MAFIYLPCFIAIFRTSSKMLTRMDEAGFFFQILQRKHHYITIQYSISYGFFIEACYHIEKFPILWDV